MGVLSSGKSSLGSLLNYQERFFFLTKILNFFPILFSGSRRRDSETVKAKVAQIIVAKGRGVFVGCCKEERTAEKSRVEDQMDICLLTT